MKTTHTCTRENSVKLVQVRTHTRLGYARTHECTYTHICEHMCAHAHTYVRCAHTRISQCMTKTPLTQNICPKRLFNRVASLKYIPRIYGLNDPLCPVKLQIRDHVILKSKIAYNIAAKTLK
jgi:hypothetical protein